MRSYDQDITEFQSPLNEEPSSLLSIDE